MQIVKQNQQTILVIRKTTSAYFKIKDQWTGKINHQQKSRT